MTQNFVGEMTVRARLVDDRLELNSGLSIETHALIEANRLVLEAKLRRERDEWIRHWRGLVQDLINGFDRYMSDDCTDAEHNRWVGLLNLTEYTEVEVLRSRYGFTGCPVVDGACKPEWPMRCRLCAGKIT